MDAYSISFGFFLLIQVWRWRCNDCIFSFNFETNITSLFLFTVVFHSSGVFKLLILPFNLGLSVVIFTWCSVFIWFYFLIHGCIYIFLKFVHLYFSKMYPRFWKKHKKSNKKTASTEDYREPFSNHSYFMNLLFSMYLCNIYICKYVLFNFVDFFKMHWYP